MKKGISCLLIIAFVIAAGLFMSKRWYNNAIYEGTGRENNYEVTIEEGTTFLDFAEELESENIIDSKTAVQIYLRLENLSPNIKAGFYNLPGDISVPDLLEILEKGPIAPGVDVTFKEGLVIEQIGELLEENLNTSTFSKAEFLRIAENPDGSQFPSEIQDFLNSYKPAGKSLQGFLYPDTYSFNIDSTAEVAINRMLENFINKIQNNLDLDNLAKNQDNFDDLYSGMILASVIEAEASAWDDRADISSVFNNRLEIDMALQSDATVNFITGKRDAGVLIVDTKIDNPFNTYFYPGLMPEPINNPRIESIKAALQPNNTTNFFFFHTPDGQTFFSETFGEHNAKVQQYLN